MKLESSKLKHLVYLLHNKNEDREFEEDLWVNLAKFYVDIKPLSENQILEFDSIKFGHILAEEYFIFSCRYNRLITNKNRLRFKNRLFEIKKIINIHEESKFMKIICLEIRG